MGRRITLSVAVLVLAALQSSGLFGGRVLPAFVLAGVLAWGLSTDLDSGLRWGLAGGVLLDVYAGHQVGMFTLAVILGYLPLFAASRGAVDELGLALKLALAAAAALIYELVLLTVINLTTTFPFFAELRDVATLNVVATTGVFLLLLGPAGKLAATTTAHARSLPQRPLSRP